VTSVGISIVVLPFVGFVTVSDTRESRVDKDVGVIVDVGLCEVLETDEVLVGREREIGFDWGDDNVNWEEVCRNVELSVLVGRSVELGN